MTRSRTATLLLTSCLCLFPSPSRAERQDLAKLVLVHVVEMGKPLELLSVQYKLDGAPVFAEEVQDPSAAREEPEEVFRANILPGEHEISVHLQFRSKRLGASNYGKVFEFSKVARTRIRVRVGQTALVKATVFDYSSDGMQPKDPRVRWQSKVSKGTAADAEEFDKTFVSVVPGPKKSRPRWAADFGFDFDVVWWDAGHIFTWGIRLGGGVRLFDRLWLKAKVVLPFFLGFFWAGNHTSFGGELEYVWLEPSGDAGFVLATSLGAAWNSHVNKQTQVLGPESPEPSECAKGLKTWALLRVGGGNENAFGGLDIGFELKSMDVKNQYALLEDQLFTGILIGLSATGRF